MLKVRDQSQASNVYDVEESWTEVRIEDLTSSKGRASASNSSAREMVELKDVRCYLSLKLRRSLRPM